MGTRQVIYKSDCHYFRGDIPCKPHKDYGVHCGSCNFYLQKRIKILVIKLGAIGDVIRTTPLLHKLKREHPDAEIWWLTMFGEIIPSVVDNVLLFTAESLLLLQATKFYKLINLDKDEKACALASIISAEYKFGFALFDGKPGPVNKLAEHKFLTGIFDDINQFNTNSYLEEIFGICGWKFDGEEYILEYDETRKWNIPNKNKQIVGLNTGCGQRWISRLWRDEYWVELINLVKEQGLFPMLLGGNSENKKNKMLSALTGAYYPGHFGLREFISLVNCCDIVVTVVTMTLHIAVGLKKNVILMNNIFNRYEFELYGRGEIVEPDRKCTCFYSPECRNEEYNCMDYLTPEKVMEALMHYVRR